jgi:hypothetical protein
MPHCCACPKRGSGFSNVIQSVIVFDIKTFYLYKYLFGLYIITKNTNNKIQMCLHY